MTTRLQSQLDELFQYNTFLPDATPDRFHRLLDRLSQQRYSTFAALYAECFQRFEGNPRLDPFFSSAVHLILLPVTQRRLIINDPVFQIWMALAFQHANAVLTEQADNTTSLQNMLLELPAVLQRITQTAVDHKYSNHPPIRRFNVDPLIAATTPPSYEFPEDESTRKHLERSGYSLHFFRDVVSVALSRIANTWPACYEQFRHLVKLICYLPDSTFRSCSAARYTGVILLSAKDHSILEIEESLVHETTHQLLYSLVEVCPIIDEQRTGERLFSLPWSGLQRDLHGYVHAFFAVLAQVKYLERVRQRPASEMQRAEERMLDILRGLIKALPELEACDEFTPRGRTFMDNLALEVHALRSRHAGLLSQSSATTGNKPAMGMAV
ncbi:HEXXH motif-containing putative peptide modification protein [Pseudomonas sp. MWU12-2037]|uniref:aKG-HExxH-type peptide beta-hydroxylase n=1 Tax=Pseudomonas sp. MWU12-2037 TaxID=2928690 RepID=UPI00200FDBBE|nr:HEXXH motif-containing putative peptide modification protein [Pseudomonas sp. MWU12-2037]